MIHEIQRTEGIILAKRNTGEANQAITIFTREFGKITAHAQAVRLTRSKLRPRLSLYSLAMFSLVITPRTTRIVDVREIIPVGAFMSRIKKLSLFARVAALLSRMLQGEEKNLFIWENLKKLLIALRSDAFNERELVRLEVKTLFDIFHNLGYIASEGGHMQEKSMVSAINKAIEESQL